MSSRRPSSRPRRSPPQDLARRQRNRALRQCRFQACGMIGGAETPWPAVWEKLMSTMTTNPHMRTIILKHVTMVAANGGKTGMGVVVGAQVGV